MLIDRLGGSSIAPASQAAILAHVQAPRRRRRFPAVAGSQTSLLVGARPASVLEQACQGVPLERIEE